MAEQDNNEEVVAQPKPFPRELFEEPESKTVGHMVRDYLWGKGPIDYGIVSPHLQRNIVSRFVGFELPDLPPQYFWRVRILADLYNLTEHLSFIQSTLKRQEAEPVDLDRSIAGTIILEEIGDAAQKDFAAQYYEYLASHRFANEKFRELIKCLAALGSRVSPAPLRSRMEKEIKALAARESSDPEAEVERRDVEEIINNDFFFVDEANESRRRILEIADEKPRLRELIKAYLDLTDDSGGEHFDLWVQQQIRRTAERNGNETVIAAFRAMVKDLGKMSGADAVFCKIRCYNAIECFLGKLDPEEEAFMAKNRAKQIDPLRFMPVPMHIDPVEEEEEVDEEDDETDNEDEV